MQSSQKRLIGFALFAWLVLSQGGVIPPNGDGEVFLYRAVQKLLPGHLPLNQKKIGSCVAVGHAGAVDELLAIDVVAGKAGKFLPCSAESIYGGARNEAYGRVGHSYSDGSNGYAAVKWLKDVGGVLFRQNYSQHGVDLTSYEVPRCKDWGARSNGGDNTVSGPLDEEAKKHPVKGAAKVTTLEELDKALENGCPVTICSGVGFASPRDKDGFCRPAGGWSHCMHICGKRNGGRKGYLVQNSWGAYIRGDGPSSENKYKDQPDGSFYVEPQHIARILRAGDSWALSSATGFPKRLLPDWLTKPDAEAPADLFKTIALKNEQPDDKAKANPTKAGGQWVTTCQNGQCRRVWRAR
ncbi:MAG: hypothetical protein JSS27_01045 [Planctomycetes bacterium]|nr:hypothetical protein [Planctomycetota bacterium]